MFDLVDVFGIKFLTGKFKVETVELFWSKNFKCTMPVNTKDELLSIDIYAFLLLDELELLNLYINDKSL